MNFNSLDSSEKNFLILLLTLGIKTNTFANTQAIDEIIEQIKQSYDHPYNDKNDVSFAFLSQNEAGRLKMCLNQVYVKIYSPSLKLLCEQYIESLCRQMKAVEKSRIQGLLEGVVSEITKIRKEGQHA